MQKNKVEELLTTLGIDINGEIIDDRYVIKLNGSDDISTLYSKLDSNDEVELDSDSLLISEHVFQSIFNSKEFEIKLVGNYDDNLYYLYILENGD